MESEVGNDSVAVKTENAEVVAPPAQSRSVLQQPEDVVETVIKPKRGWQAVDIRELIHFRELLYFLVWRDVKVRYKQTVLGAFWAILQPLLGMVIFSIIFGRFLKVPSEGVPYPIFVYAGLLPWTFFSNSVSHSGLSLVSQVHLLTKTYFPRLMIPSASIGVFLVDFALSFGVYMCIMLWYMHLPGIAVLFLPALILLVIITALGTGYLLASLSIVYRDFRFVIPFMLQAWMYASPVVYSDTSIPEQYRWILALNPMAGIIRGFRSALLNQPMDWMALGISASVGLCIFVLGLFYFRRTERRFADIA